MLSRDPKVRSALNQRGSVEDLMSLFKDRLIYDPISLTVSIRPRNASLQDSKNIISNSLDSAHQKKIDSYSERFSRNDIRNALIVRSFTVIRMRLILFLSS